MTEYTITMDSGEYKPHCIPGRYSEYQVGFNMLKTDTVKLVNVDTGESIRKKIVYKYGENTDKGWVYTYLLDTLHDNPVFRSVCYNCGQSLIWDSDAQDTDPDDGKEYLYHFLHCANCNAKITYKVPL